MAQENLRNVVNLADILFSKREFSLLKKILIFVLVPANEISKILTKLFLIFNVMLNLGHTLHQLKIIQINRDLKAIAISYQINYPAVLKPS